jgi:hypothetical protein
MQQVLDYLGLKGTYVQPNEYFTARSEMPIAVGGFTQMIAFHKQAQDAEVHIENELMYGAQRIDIRIYSDSTTLNIVYDTIKVTFDLSATFKQTLLVADSAGSNYVIIPSDLLTTESGDQSIRLVIEHAYFAYIRKKEFRLESCRGFLLIK